MTLFGKMCGAFYVGNSEWRMLKKIMLHSQYIITAYLFIRVEKLVLSS